jgi:arginase
MLRKEGLTVVDYGDLPVRRWRPDKKNVLAQHWETVVACVQETDTHLKEAVRQGYVPVVIGGNCTIELGVVAANLRKSENLGLIYLDLHADMNTPASTTDGALDWMGMAHMLGLKGTIPQLAGCGPKFPLLAPGQVHLVGFDPNSATEWERNTVQQREIATSMLAEVAKSPVKCAEDILFQWAAKFERFLVHFDVDVIDYNDLPLAENYSKNKGLSYHHAMELLEVWLQSPKFGGLTVTEINPDHGAEDGSTIRSLARDLAVTLGLGSGAGKEGRATQGHMPAAGR